MLITEQNHNRGLYPRIQRPRPLKQVYHGLKAMTLCIGAHALWEDYPSIVLCFDHQIGDDYSKSTPTFKCETHFWGETGALWSGTLDHVEDSLRTYKARLTGKTPMLADFKEELWVGFQEFMGSLSRRGQDKTDVQLIIGGYVEAEPTLVQVDAQGVSAKRAFCAIGSGEYIADAMLRWRNTSRESELDEVLYAAYEAKTMAEIGPHVGSTTTMRILRRTDKAYTVSEVQEKVMARLKKYFRKVGPKKFVRSKEQFPYGGII